MNIKAAVLALLSFTLLLSCKESGTNDNPETDMKIDQLLSQMTLKEKIGQLCQAEYENTDSLKIKIKNGEVGSLINVTDPNEVNEVQKIAMEQSRLKIPVLIGRDVIHGFKTIFPIPIGQAATFNPEIVEQGAAVAAAEARSVGITWTFAPMLDIARDARWGRICESPGEDPYLAGVMGAAMVRGFQGKNLSDRTSLAACAKHFVGYGASEGGKDYNNTDIPERLLRNLYLPSFKAAVDAGVASIMVSFSANDGVPSTANSYLLKNVLRDEWNFNGFVVSDWGSIEEMVIHGFCANDEDAAEKAINAGVEMEMVSKTYHTYLEKLVKSGKVSEKTIDNAVRNILRIKFESGLFDDPYVDMNTASAFYAKESLEKAKTAAEQSIILLKNEEQTLPLSDKIKTLAVIGPMADAPHDQLGTWTFDGEKDRTITPLSALKEMYGDKVNILYEQGLKFSRDRDVSGFAKAVATARKADVIVAVVGEEAILSGEAHCLTDIDLKGAQSELITELKKTGKPLVLIVMAGRPLTIEREVDLSDAVLYAFHPGTAGGPAIADLLFGKVVPSGKLPVTFPKRVGQIPVYYNHNNTGRPPKRQEMLIDDIPLEAEQPEPGNTSYYLDAGFDPLFPFGYGLSYTTFDYSDLTLNKNIFRKNEQIEVSVKLKNSGKYTGTEVVQLYIRDIAGSIIRPVKELKGFKRVSLNPGEEQIVTMTLSTDDLAFFGHDMKKTTEPGDFAIWMGGNSQDGPKLTFTIE